MNIKRPEVEGFAVTTPKVALSMFLCGRPGRHGPFAPSNDEHRNLQKLYGFVNEKPGTKPPRPVFTPDPNAKPWELREAEAKHKEAVQRWEQWEDPRVMLQAGADLNLMRHAEVDGLRLVAWLAQFVPPGEDPLKTLIQLASDAGWDVDPEDRLFAGEEPEEG